MRIRALTGAGMAVLLIGITNQKSVEFAYTRDRLTAAGATVLVADGGSRKPAFQADVKRTSPSGSLSGTELEGLQIRDPKSAMRKRAVCATLFTTTFPGVRAARAHLEAAECEVDTFLSTGQMMEERIAEGQFAGVLDLTTTELADELIGGASGAGPDRLTAAAMKGVPQVIGVGALDTVKFFPRSRGVPAKFDGRRFHEHDSQIRLMRTTPEENDRLGLEIAQKACAARGPTAIILPLRGVSSLDIEGGPFWWPEADAALFQSLRNWVAGVELIELDMHINDPAFGRIAAETLLRLMGRR